MSPSREAQRGAHVVDHRAAGLGERVVRAPVRRAAVAVGRVLEQLDAQVGPALGQHPPHRARLGAAEVDEDRVGEVDVGRVAGLHRRAVALREGAVEALDDGLVLSGHDAATLSSARASREACHRRTRARSRVLRQAGVDGRLRGAVGRRRAALAGGGGPRAAGDVGLHARPRRRVRQRPGACPSRATWTAGETAACGALRVLARASTSSCAGRWAARRGWLGRARRLVEREERDCVEQGYLLLPLMFEHAGRRRPRAPRSPRPPTPPRSASASATRDLFALAGHEQGILADQAGAGRRGSRGCSTRPWWRSPPASCRRSSTASSTAA